MVVTLVDPCSKAIQHFEKFLIKVSDKVPFIDKSLAEIKEYKRWRTFHRMRNLSKNRFQQLLFIIILLSCRSAGLSLCLEGNILNRVFCFHRLSCTNEKRL